jgi:sugar phosphate isomerase/epimerase
MPDLALQLYSLRNETAKDPEGILLQVPGLGYRDVEFAGDYGWSPEKWNELLAKTGLSVVGAHTLLPDLEAKFDTLVEFHKKIGNSRFIVPWLAESWRTVAGFQEVARSLNEWGKKVREAGLTFHYHNHDFEFKPVSDGSTGMEILVKETDPDLVHFEVDTFWVEKSGLDALTFLKKHEERISLIHAKELRKKDQMDVAAGQGDINFKEIIPLAVKRGWPVVVEYEGQDALRVVKESAAYLSKL